MKIMIADDHGLVREGLTQLLKSMDEQPEIIEAKTSQDILKYAKEKIDLLLLDLNMPGIESVKRVEYICDKLPTTAVIVVSGVESNHIASACIEAGAMGFIPKSSSNQVMKSAIQIVLSGEHYIPILHQINQTNRATHLKIYHQDKNKFGCYWLKVCPTKKLRVNWIWQKAL